MPKSYPKFYNLNAAALLSGRFLEDAVMAECDLSYEEVKELTEDEMRWSLIGNRHDRNGSVIKSER